jgi:hypothetical protein
MFGLTDWSLSTDISTYKTVWESLWHVDKLVFNLFPYTFQDILWKHLVAYMKIVGLYFIFC